MEFSILGAFLVGITAISCASAHIPYRYTAEGLNLSGAGKKDITLIFAFTLMGTGVERYVAHRMYSNSGS